MWLHFKICSHKGPGIASTKTTACAPIHALLPPARPVAALDSGDCQQLLTITAILTVKPSNKHLLYIMLDIREQQQRLSELGARLKTLRLARNDTMAVFAQRLGVSAGTLRAMEHGAPTVQIGAWVKALWVLDQLDDLSGVLVQNESLLERARAPRAHSRQRASRRIR